MTRELGRTFEGLVPRRALKAAARESFRLWACEHLDIMQYPAMTPQNVHRYGGIQGEDHLARPMREGRGVIIALAHFGANKFVIPALSLRGYPFTQVGLRVDDWQANRGSASAYVRLMLHIEQHAESRWPAQFVYGEAAMLPVVRRLKAGKTVCIAVDGGAPRKIVPVPVGNRTIFLSPTFSRLARLTGAAVVPTFVLRGKGGLNRIEILEELPIDRSCPGDAGLVQDTRRFGAILDTYVRRFPAHYYRCLVNSRRVTLQGGLPKFEDQIALMPEGSQAFRDRLKQECVA